VSATRSGPLPALVAPDSFKGTFSASEVAAAIASGLRAAGREAHELPVADGGEGTMDVLVSALGGELHSATVSDPLGRPVEATFALLPDGAAVVEMARASGLSLVDESERDAWAASTRGTGELIAAAVEAGAERLIVTVGGSATTDGGAGAIEALSDAGLLPPPGRPATGRAATGRPATGRPATGRPATGRSATGRSAAGRPTAGRPTAARDSRAPRTAAAARRSAAPLAGLEMHVVCDVRVPFERAPSVFGPQKGADAAMVKRLEQRLGRLAETLPRDPRGEPMTGAAGGLSGGLWAACGATLVPGAPYVLDTIGFDALMRGSAFVVTGEGALDDQTLEGKIVGELATRCRQGGVACHAVVGRNRLDPFGERIIDLASVTEASTLADLKRAGSALVEH
jgi:glycerate kinase